MPYPKKTFKRPRVKGAGRTREMWRSCKRVGKIFPLSTIRSIRSLLHVTKDMQPGLKLLLTDALKCKICLDSPAKPPLILAKCCKSILGCQQCVNGWYKDGGLTKSCPACRSPRGLSETMVLLGLDELAEGVRDVLQQ